MVLLAMPRGILFVFQRVQPCCRFVFDLPGHTGAADAQWQMIQCPCSGSWIHLWACVVLDGSHAWGLRSNCFCVRQEQKVSVAPTPACKPHLISLSQFGEALWLKQPLHRSVLDITENILLIFSRDCAAENRHIIPANLALMWTWFLLALFTTFSLALQPAAWWESFGKGWWLSSRAVVDVDGHGVKSPWHVDHTCTC